MIDPDDPPWETLTETHDWRTDKNIITNEEFETCPLCSARVEIFWRAEDGRKVYCRHRTITNSGWCEASRMIEGKIATLADCHEKLDQILKLLEE